MTILFITDSLGFSRVMGSEKVNYNETYINLVKSKFPEHEIIHLGIGGGTIINLLRQSNYYESLLPDTIFIQSGIVDCAPRALTEFEIELINRTPFFSKLISKTIKKHSIKLRNFRKITYTNPKRFKLALSRLIKKFNTEYIFAIGILPTSLEYENIVSGISENVNHYNSLIKNEIGGNYISTHDFTKQDIMSDHHHLSKEGHTKLSNKIIEAIEKLKK
jgi:lysophospholipase L1-like esterase